MVICEKAKKTQENYSLTETGIQREQMISLGKGVADLPQMLQMNAFRGKKHNGLHLIFENI